MTTTTKTDEREQWRSRILRALAELQTDVPGLDRAGPSDTHERERTNHAEG